VGGLVVAPRSKHDEVPSLAPHTLARIGPPTLRRQEAGYVTLQKALEGGVSIPPCGIGTDRAIMPSSRQA